MDKAPKNKFDLGFGNSVCVREAFLAETNAYVSFPREELLCFDYPDHDGDPDLIEITKKVIKRQTGLEYDHVFLTNGATGGVVIALRAYAQMSYTYCHTRNAPFYIRYPQMINAAGLMHVQENHVVFTNESVVLIDVPSNPLGIVDTYEKALLMEVPTILDGVYLNNVYTTGNVVPPAHDVFVGSYSKLLGINGIRVGWIATNNGLLAERIRELVASEYCGLSTASTAIIKISLDYDFNWLEFEKNARLKLDSNREEWSKLEKFFGNYPVLPVGMFHYGTTDKKCKELLNKAGVHFTSGVDLGTSDKYGRFNLGQTNQLTKSAVRAILKADKL